MTPPETAIAQAIQEADEEALDALADRIAQRIETSRLQPIIKQMVLRCVSELWSITHQDVQIEMRKIAREALEDIIRELRPKPEPLKNGQEKARAT